MFSPSNIPPPQSSPSLPLGEHALQVLFTHCIPSLYPPLSPSFLPPLISPPLTLSSPSNISPPSTLSLPPPNISPLNPLPPSP